MLVEYNAEDDRENYLQQVTVHRLKQQWLVETLVWISTPLLYGVCNKYGRESGKRQGSSGF